MHVAVEQTRAAGATALEPATRDRFVARDEALLAAGVAQNPQPPPPTLSPRRRGRRKQSPARNLLDRLWTYEHEALAFLDDFAVPFDNNQAERDLRPVKIQQKISGTFRSEPGTDAFCILRSVLSTWRKQGQSALAALDAAFAGRSLSLQAQDGSWLATNHQTRHRVMRVRVAQRVGQRLLRDAVGRNLDRGGQRGKLVWGLDLDARPGVRWGLTADLQRELM
jgi:hypothetical protein